MPAAQPEVDTVRRTVRIPVALRLAAFAAGDPPSHHLIAWAGGGAGGKALLQTSVSDTAVLDALERLGGIPGDNLRAESWTARADPTNSAPDLHAIGALLELSVVLADGTRRPLSDLLDDLDGHGFAWRLAGNRALIPRWRSGCVVCLQSCPGAKVANANATMRDHYRGQSRFRPSAWARELGEGAQLVVELRLLAPPPGER